MLLTIHNLPSNFRSVDVKTLLHVKCSLTELMLDNLVLTEGNTKRVTVGLVDEEDAAILVRKIHGMYINGLQLYVEDKRKKRNISYMGLSSCMLMPAAQPRPLVLEPRPPVPVNERGLEAYQRNDGAPGERPREPPRDEPRSRDCKWHVSLAEPAKDSDMPSHREQSPPRQRWTARDPLRTPPRTPPEPATRWEPQPDLTRRSEPEAPWRDSPPRTMGNDNQPFDNWERDSSPESEGMYPSLDWFEPNDSCIDDSYPPSHHEPEFHGHSREEADDRDARPRPEEDRNSGSSHRIINIIMHPRRKELVWVRRQEPRQPARLSNLDNHNINPSNSNCKERRDDQDPNPATRPAPERQRCPAGWDHVVNYSPTSKLPGESIDISTPEPSPGTTLLPSVVQDLELNTKTREKGKKKKKKRKRSGVKRMRGQRIGSIRLPRYKKGEEPKPEIKMIREILKFTQNID